jgi:hypothetical protein
VRIHRCSIGSQGLDDSIGSRGLDDTK